MQNAFQARYYLYSLLAGACLVLSFAPFNFYPLAFISPAILFYLLLITQRRSHAVKLGWAFGVGLFGAGASWVFQSMHGFAQAPLLLAALLTVLFVLILALQVALFAWVASLFRRCLLVVRLLIVYPAAWVLIEWIRGWLFTGFPWLYLGHAHSDNWLAHFAPIGGSLLVSWVSAVIAGGMVVVVAADRAERNQPVKLPTTNYVRVAEPLSHWNQGIAVAVIAILVGASWLLSTFQWVTPTQDRLTASLVQANIAQDQKWLPEQKVPSVERYMKMTRDNWQSDLIVWPETAVPGRLTAFNDLVLSPMHHEAMENNTSLVIGGFHQTESGLFENSALALGDDVEELDLYSKRHLVPLGEYIPLLKYLQWLDQWMSIPYDNLSRGSGDGLLSVGKYQAQMSICYEDAFGEEIIADLPEADFLINLTNDGWFSDSLQPYQHMQIARFRALETGRYLLRVTNTGVSGIINHDGELMHTAPAYSQAVITGEVQVMSGTTPYVRYGNYLVVGLCLLLLGVMGVFVYRGRSLI